jgi:predicted NBD/HSP70 family sugar kinase
MQIINTANIRAQNKKMIVEYLRSEPATKKVLSYQLDLSFATVSNLCNQMIEENILEVTSTLSSNGGRIPGLISIRPDARYILCLDFNKLEDAAIAIVNLNHDIIDSTKMKIDGHAEYEEIINTFYGSAMELIAKHSTSMDRLLGVGVAIPGIFHKTNHTVINSTNPLFENKPLKADIEQRFGLPAYLENESNLLALASLLKDSESGDKKDIIFLYLGEGLGVGITRKGSLLTGNRGFGGEISHIPIGTRQFPCYCGKAGCAESELTIAGFYKKWHGDKYAVPDIPSVWWEEFIQSAASGDERALRVIEENGQLLGKLISVLANMLDPDEVHIGGITEPLYSILHPHLLAEMQSRMMTRDYYLPAIHNSMGYEQLLIKGCSELVFKQWSP